ncbi:proteasome subunit RPN8 (RPN8) [Vairimorpha necatrix]|uniref:Proteasome subunit RPN8 (RPN8) n=1 Tax=Vairimorpha necatrix TaxID=6039 RepID=A0AAX4J8V4_9MICR
MKSALTKQDIFSINKSSVVVHPLVLLSAVDHYKRLNSKRVIGCLLGEYKDELHITNSFAIPFEETEDEWFYDTSYLQNMYELFHKVNSKEQIVGWYHTGPKMYKNDIEITKSFLKVIDNPYLVIINIHSEDYDLPIQIFKLNKEKDFVHINGKVEAEEAEEVGVEHLIRDLRTECSGSLKDNINIIRESLNVYYNCVSNIEDYIQNVIDGKREYNHEIINLLQEILNSIPNLNDNLEVNMSYVYLCELIKSTINLNELKNNRQENEIAS